MLFAGVTLITHGFGGSADGWVSAMGTAIARQPGVDASIYKITATDAGTGSGSINVSSPQLVSGDSPASVSNPEIILLLDWSSLAGKISLLHPFGGYHRSTVDVASAVASELLDPTFFPGLSAPLADLPFHFIGHSRGGSLVSELAKDLGTRGVWVDQVTTLDPHPVNETHGIDPGDFGDTNPQHWDNINFFDNYWRSDALELTPDGQSIVGALNDPNTSGDSGIFEQLLESDGGYSTLSGGDHSNVHLWYQGTIDTSQGASDGTETVPATWYGNGSAARNQTGFYYSQIVSGARPSSGIGDTFGGTAATVHVSRAGTQWPNIDELQLTDSGSQFQVGQTLQAQFRFEDDTAAPTVTLYLDTDQNPFDGLPNQVDDEPLAQQTGVSPATPIQLDTSNVSPGNYYLVARISDGQNVRYAYDPSAITLDKADGPDLTGSIVSAPASLPPQAKKNQVQLLITNSGNLRAKGTIPIALYASPDGSSHTDADLITTANQKLNLPAGGSKTATIKFSFPSNVPDGDYYLLAVIDGTNVLSETNTNDKVAVASTTTTIRAPFIDLAGSFYYVPSTISRGQRSIAGITLTNNGNVTAKGRLATDIYVSPDNSTGTGDTFISELLTKLNLKPGQSKFLTVKFTVPDAVQGNYLEGFASFSGPFSSALSSDDFFSDKSITLQ